MKEKQQKNVCSTQHSVKYNNYINILYQFNTVISHNTQTVNISAIYLKFYAINGLITQLKAQVDNYMT